MRYIKSYHSIFESSDYSVEYGTSLVPDAKGYTELTYKISFDEFKELTADIVDICKDGKYEDEDNTDDVNYGVTILRRGGVDYCSNIHHALKCKLINMDYAGIDYEEEGNFNNIEDIFKFSNLLNEVLVKLKPEIDALSNRLSDLDCPYFITVYNWDLVVDVYQFKPFAPDLYNRLKRKGPKG